MAPSDTPLHHAAEQHFVQNLRALLGTTAHTQAALANELNQRGLRWTQTTVSRVLSGSRGLSLGEAAAIAETLSTPLGLMLEAGGDALVRANLLTALERVEVALKAQAAASEEVAQAHAALRELLRAGGGVRSLLSAEETARLDLVLGESPAL